MSSHGRRECITIAYISFLLQSKEKPAFYRNCFQQREDQLQQNSSAHQQPKSLLAPEPKNEVETGRSIHRQCKPAYFDFAFGTLACANSSSVIS
jgi:hypothetical protein